MRAEDALTELEVLLEQLDELLGDGAVDADDALEVAIVAGSAARLGAGEEVLEPAVTWRDGPGRELLEIAFEELEIDELIEQIDAVIDGVAEEEEVEEALYDFDDVVVAAIWSGHTGAVRKATREVAKTIRQLPDSFAPLADVGVSMARLPAVAEHLDLYDYWLALADASEG